MRYVFLCTVTADVAPRAWLYTMLTPAVGRGLPRYFQINFCRFSSNLYNKIVIKKDEPKVAIAYAQVRFEEFLELPDQHSFSIFHQHILQEAKDIYWQLPTR